MPDPAPPAAPPRRALVTGVTGQDGSYLAEFLLSRGYEVHGLVRRASSFNRARIEHIPHDPHTAGNRLFLHYGDLSDGLGLHRLVDTVQPDEVYNLAAQSHVRVSFDNPLYTSDITGHGTLRMLEAVRDLARKKLVRFYQASSSEMFGDATDIPQSESTPFRPRSPYACAKVFAHLQTVNYREAYGLFACSGILFNHESPRRGPTFVTRKITRAAARIKLGLDDKLFLGNLDAKRDWGYAPEYVEAMWRMLQHDQPRDYVIATGESHTVEEFLARAFERVDLDWHDHVAFDERYLRPTEVPELRGDPSRARSELGWSPQTSFVDLVNLMVDADLAAEKAGRNAESADGPSGVA
jgi:GDPmannose 4,6-dehydratase